MLFVETRRQPEVGQLDMPILVDENVVGFDISVGQSIDDRWHPE